jgi:hypothetical protein
VLTHFLLTYEPYLRERERERDREREIERGREEERERKGNRKKFVLWVK